MKTVLNYTLMPNDILEDQSLTNSQKMLYALILKYSGKNSVCFASQRLLANQLGLKSARQVRNLLKVLVARNLIEVIAQTGRLTTNNYKPLVTVYGKCISPHTGNLFTVDKGSVFPTKNTYGKVKDEKKGGILSISEIMNKRMLKQNIYTASKQKTK